MPRSLGFGSNASYSSAHLRLAFAAPTPNGLSLHDTLSRWPIIQEVRRQLSPPTACRHPVSGTISLPSSGFFSPFPHGTGSLSVGKEYLGLEGGPPTFRQDFTCPALLEHTCRFTDTGLSPAMALLSRRFSLCNMYDWPGPVSLVTTTGVSVDVLSSGYLDISVHRVRFDNPMYSGINTSYKYHLHSTTPSMAQ